MAIDQFLKLNYCCIVPSSGPMFHFKIKVMVVDRRATEDIRKPISLLWGIFTEF